MADRPPDDALVTYTVGRVDRAIRNRLLEILAPFELSVPQFTTLSVLKRRPGLSNAQLARRALIAPQSMIQVVVVLEQRRLVQRAPDPAHHRVLQTRLTADGHALIERAEDAARAFEDELVAAAGGPAQAAAIVDGLQRWLEAMR